VVILGIVVVVLVAASAEGTPLACEEGSHGDYASQFHERGEHYARDLGRAKRLMAGDSNRRKWLERLGSPSRKLAADKMDDTYLWVYGLHNKSETCKAGALETSYFTQYRLIKVQFRSGLATSCRVLSHAYFTPQPLPDPLSPDSAPPWDKDVDCAAAEP
jgi:hypothetical protein